MICFQAATYHFHDSLEFLYQKKNAEEYPLHGTHFTDPYLGSCQVDFFPGEELYFVYFFLVQSLHVAL